MLDENDCITEGLSSNFGIISAEGQLVTAPSSDVLPGTVMHMVGQACQQLGISVVERRPCLHEDWQAAFVCSTSRLVIPVMSVDPIQKKVNSLDSQLLQQIMQKVQEICNSI